MAESNQYTECSDERKRRFRLKISYLKSPESVRGFKHKLKQTIKIIRENGPEKGEFFKYIFDLMFYSPTLNMTGKSPFGMVNNSIVSLTPIPIRFHVFGHI
jgi:hypothetical protein